jgi:CYTH domain-containing protein
LDVYAGALENLIVAEVEFLSIQEAERFIPPTWFGVEVTMDVRFKNRCLAGDGKPMLE